MTYVFQETLQRFDRIVAGNMTKDILTTKDILQKCYDFVSDPRVISPQQIELAVSLFGGVSPPDNAGPWFTLEGDTYLQFSSNDYLGLAAHPDVRARVVEVAERYGICSPMGARHMTGTTCDHLELERRVAEFKRCDDAIIFASGSMAMMGMLAALANPRDVLLLDQCAHASLVCGAKISGASIVYFRHNDIEHLEHLLYKLARERAAAIVVDGVYSMQGDLAPLAELVELKNRHQVRLIVDDAHGTGVFGPEGRGVAAAQGVEEQVDLHAGTFSKSCGTTGGFVAGNETIIKFLRFNAPTYLFTKSPPLAVVAATIVALDLVQQADEARKQLWRNARRLQTGLVNCGFDIGRTESPITPVRYRGTEALAVAGELRQIHRIWAAPVIFPVVEMGTSVLRLIPTARHTAEDIDELIESIQSA